MNKRFFKFISMVVCLTLLFGLTKGVMVANATETPDYPVVSSMDELLAAIERADHGDTIGIDCRIEYRESVTLGNDNKMITISRETETAAIALYGDGTSTIKNLTIEGNEIEAGNSMIYIEQNADFQNVIFQNCICLYDYGGAIRLSGGTYNLTNCIFKNNAAYGGGHLMLEEAYCTIDGCTFREGRADENGGAISIQMGSGYEIKNSTVKGNYAAQYGGGIYFSGNGVLSQTKLFHNSAEKGGDDYAKDKGITVSFAESVVALAPLFESDNLKPIEWEVQTIDSTRSGAKLILEDITPTEPEEPDETEPTEPDEPTEEPEQPTNPDESETPGESEPTEPDTPQDNTPEETPPSDDEGTGEPDRQPEENTPSNSTVDNSTTDNSVTDNSNTDNSSTTGDIITDNSSSSSTDNSTSSNYESTTDNSRYSNTTDSNNTSTVNNYYTQPGTQPSNNQPEVQTIVVPVGNTGSGEPIEQMITIQSSPEGNGSGSLEGMTLNVNVNIGSENAADQQEALSPSTVQQSGASWYQVAVLCLLSAILVCVIRRR